MSIKYRVKKFYQPTPIKWRKLGDALLSVGTAITGFAIYEQHQGVAMVALIVTVAGKFLTNFFTEDV